MSIRRARLKSLAKINLDLRVLHKRSDGFHELRTVFQTISLADTIDIEYQPARRTELLLDDPLAIPDNLVLRAARAVLHDLRIHARVSFRLRKQIPMGGGLGGGSSNAATVLLALPALAGKPIPLGRLHEIAAELGSDVPFFLLGGTAVGIGRGTELYPLRDVTPEPILIVSSGLHVATGPAYQALGRGLTVEDWSSKINGFQAFVQALGGGRSAKAAMSFSANDFEAVVFRQYPQLKTIALRLSKHGAVRMTGSGSALVGVFDSREQRDRAKEVFEKEYLVKAAALVDRSSYQRLWRRQSNLSTDLWPPHSRYAR